MTEEVIVGVLGGSGLYDIEGFEDKKKIALATPFGEPSDEFLVGRLDGVQTVFLPRHGRGHRLTPTEINSRANVWGMRKLGVSKIVSVSAVGSMREGVVPGDFVMIDQFFDRTRHRPDTFFGDGVVAHVGFADPICEELRQTVLKAGAKLDVKMHDGGTYLNMEGPQFSTKAESRIYRSWGVDVIGMTNLQEARLAREAEIAYCTVAMATDYDCWHEGHDAVTVRAVIEIMRRNVGQARKLIKIALPNIAKLPPSPCEKALENAIMTAPEAITAEARTRLALFLDRYYD